VFFLFCRKSLLTTISRVVYSLLIINKAGGLVYNRSFHQGLQSLSTNDYLVLAGTFHGVHAITRSLAPAAAIADTIDLSGIPASGPSTSQQGQQPAQQSSAHQNPTAGSFLSPQASAKAQLTGLEVLESALFRLTCFQTASGVKFLLFTEPQQPNVDQIMKRVYELYADYVMKNPFYSLEMPVRCEAFERHLMAYVRAR
jgi:trafficking protein particle complex subunit 4